MSKNTRKQAAILRGYRVLKYQLANDGSALTRREMDLTLSVICLIIIITVVYGMLFCGIVSCFYV